jgi:ASC-1-like (ASCH) protein
MQKEHEIKIRIEFCDAVVSGDKPFEVRLNDRGYQKGDTIKFKALDSMGLSVYHDIDYKKYHITFVLNGWGISDGYVVFGIKEIPQETD